jgi:hypothetical protein
MGFLPRARIDPVRQALVEELKGRMRAALGLGEDDGLSLSEIVCADPGCPGTETVVLVMRLGQATEALKIAKPLAEIGEVDIAELAGGDGAPTNGQGGLETASAMPTSFMPGHVEL